MESYQELLAKRDELNKKINDLKEMERDGVVAEIKQKIADFQITAVDLGLKKAKKEGFVRAAVAPKYRDTESGKTWSGRGKSPKWLEGKNRNDFLIGAV